MARELAAVERIMKVEAEAIAGDRCFPACKGTAPWRALLPRNWSTKPTRAKSKRPELTVSSTSGKLGLAPGFLFYAAAGARDRGRLFAAECRTNFANRSKDW